MFIFPIVFDRRCVLVPFGILLHTNVTTLAFRSFLAFAFRHSHVLITNEGRVDCRFNPRSDIIEMRVSIRHERYRNSFIVLVLTLELFCGRLELFCTILIIGSTKANSPPLNSQTNPISSILIQLTNATKTNQAVDFYCLQLYQTK